MKRWAARLTLMVLSPALLLLAMELGYRALLWSTIAPQTEGEAFELYAIGASSVRGEPYDEALGFPQMLVTMFGGELQGRRLRVHLLAESGYSIYPQVVALRRALAFRDSDNPAAVLIYAGHNENLGPTLDDAGLRFWKSLKNRLMARSLLFADVMLRYERRNNTQDIRDLAHYEYWLRRALVISREAGAEPIVSTVVSNVAGIEPGVALRDTQHAAGVHQRLTELAERSSAEGCAATLAPLEEAAAKDRKAAPLYDFQRARCLRELGRADEAWRIFVDVLARAPSRHFGRARPAQNALIRRLATRYAIPLVDAWELFRAHAPDGIIDAALFADGHHPNLEGYRLLAAEFARALARGAGLSSTPAPIDLEHFLNTKGIGPGALAGSHALAASWLFSVSTDHPWPKLRLALAETHIDAALRLHPLSFDAWLMRGLIQCARHSPALLFAPEELTWLHESGLFYSGWDLCQQTQVLDTLLDRLIPLGLAPDTAAQIRKAAAHDRQGRCDE